MRLGAVIGSCFYADDKASDGADTRRLEVARNSTPEARQVEVLGQAISLTPDGRRGAD